MRVFVIAAMGSVALANCAPFQHGHYSEDVAYLNSKGDPPGTPLVYQPGLSQATQVADITYTAPSSVPLSPQTTTTVTSNAFGAGGFPTLDVGQQSVQFNQPVGISVPAPSIGIQQASVVAPTFSAPVVSAPVSYAPAIQQTYVAPVQPRALPIVRTVSAPVRQTIVQSVIPQAPAPQFVRQRVERASFVAPTKPRTSNLLATSYSGHQVDADGYAICNIPVSDHAARQISGFKPAYQPASHIQRSQPQGLLRF